MKGHDLWMRIFNTDFEESVLSYFGIEKNFDDEGTVGERALIEEKLDGMTLSQIVNIHCEYYGYGIDASNIAGWIDMLQIEDIETIKNWESGLDEDED